MLNFALGFAAGVIVTVASPKVYAYGMQAWQWLKDKTSRQ